MNRVINSLHTNSDISSAVDSLSRAWCAAGVEEGTTLLVHSSTTRTIRSLRRTGLAGLTPDHILASFLGAVGDAGTLLVPIFNFDFTKGVPFDIRTTPSQMGALTEAARLHPAAIRTGHPIYSFVAIGRCASQFAAIDNFSGYGSDSPFAVLRELGGSIAVLDLPDQHSMTFYHHVEEMLQVPYRSHKTFVGSYTDRSGTTSAKTYGLFVRNLDQGVETDVERMGEHLWHIGLYHGDRPLAGTGLRVIRAQALFDETARIIDSGQAEGMLYSIKRPTNAPH